MYYLCFRRKNYHLSKKLVFQAFHFCFVICLSKSISRFSNSEMRVFLFDAALSCHQDMVSLFHQDMVFFYSNLSFKYLLLGVLHGHSKDSVLLTALFKQSLGISYGGLSFCLVLSISFSC